MGRRRALLSAAALALLGGIALPAAGAGASSKPSESVPECSRDAVPQCHIDITLGQASPTSGGICDSFESGSGYCVGDSTGNSTWSVPSYFPRQGLQSSFTWKSQGRLRLVEFEARASPTIVQASIKGRVPSPASAEFVVTDAFNRGPAHWHSGTSGKPGSVGGPLYIDYEHRVVGSYVHMYGYLERT